MSERLAQSISNRVVGRFLGEKKMTDIHQNRKCLIYGSIGHAFEFDFADSEKSVFVCLCGEEVIEFEDAGTGA